MRCWQPSHGSFGDLHTKPGEKRRFGGNLRVKPVENASSAALWGHVRPAFLFWKANIANFRWKTENWKTRSAPSVDELQKRPWRR
jgi:hypothetical protein